MDKLNGLCDKYLNSNRTGHFREVFAKVQPQIRRAKEDYHSDFLVMVIGAFSAGKSTLINSLVKKHVCEVGIRPTTDEIHKIKLPNVQRLSIIDSPGLDALGQESHSQKALEAAQRANMAILVLNVRQPFRESERPLIRELVGSKPDIIVALNYWNSLEETEREDALDYVKKTTDELLPGAKVKIVPLNAKDRDDSGVKAIRDHVLELQGSAMTYQKMRSASAAVARDAAEIFTALLKHKEVLAEAHNGKMRAWGEKQREASKDYKHAKQLQRVEESSRQAHKQNVRHTIERLEDKLARTSPGGFWSGAASGALIDAFTGGATLGIPTLLGGVVGALCTHAGDEEERGRIKNDIERQHEKLLDLDRQQKEYDFSSKDSLDRIEQDMQSDKEEFHAIMQDIDADIRLLEGMIPIAYDAYEACAHSPGTRLV